MLKGSFLTGLVMVVFLFSAIAHAADTTEAYDIGATDYEFYTGFDGIGLDRYEKTIWAEVVLGYGFLERFAGHVSVFGESNEYFGEGGGGFLVGMFGTPVDTDHFDLDLHIDAGYAVDEFTMTPSLEMNFDLLPDMEKWGVYIRAAEDLAGRDESVEDDPASAADESKTQYAFAPSTGLLLGTYFMAAPEHQLLLEYDTYFAHNPAAGEETMEIGGVTLGYNVIVHDSIEMINQLFFDIPQNGEKFAVGISTGIIITMPAAAEPETAGEE